MARCVGSVVDFEAHHWGRRPLLRRAVSGRSFCDVFTTADLDHFLAGGIRSPVVRMVQNGSPVPGERYTSRVRLGGSDFRDVVDPDRVAEVFAAGATVVAQSLHRTHPKVRTFAEQLGNEISHPLQANAYLTPPNATGLSTHADGHDVIVIQLDGSKRWTVDPLGEFELGPGDTLYIPAGTEHMARSTDRTSLHLTVGILRVTYRSVLDRLMRHGPSRLDRPLPLRYRSGGSDLEIAIRHIVDEVRDHLASLDITEVERTERERRIARPPAPGALCAAIGRADLRRTATVERDTGAWTVSTTGDSMVRVDTPGRWLLAPLSCERAIHRLSNGEPAMIGDLDGLDDDSQLVLVRRLVATGLCRIVDR